MAAAAAGDPGAPWALLALVGGPLRRMLRCEVARLGGRASSDDLEGLVLDAVLELASLAGAWAPGGAPPWVWARHRILGLARHFVDVRADVRIDEAGHGLAELADRSGRARTADVEWRRVLRSLADRRADARAVEAALAATTTDRDAEIWLEVEAERAVGNRHAAVTVGARFGVSPAAVRKVTQRVRARLAAAA